METCTEYYPEATAPLSAKATALALFLAREASRSCVCSLREHVQTTALLLEGASASAPTDAILELVAAVQKSADMLRTGLQLRAQVEKAKSPLLAIELAAKIEDIVTGGPHA